MAQEKQFAANGRALFYGEFPKNGRPMVFLHGVSSCWKDFQSLIPAFTENWHIYGLNFRGHGGSEWQRDHYLVADYVEDAQSFVDTVLDEPAVIYGHSLGAMAAVALAARTPDRVRGIILEDPPFGTMGPRIVQTPWYPLFSQMHQLALEGLELAPLTDRLGEISLPVPGGQGCVRLKDIRDYAALRFNAECLRSTDPEVFSPLVEGRWLDGYDFDSLSKKITCPTLFLQADSNVGGALSDADVLMAISTIKNSSVVSFPGTGHLIHEVEPKRVLRLIRGFLESLEFMNRDPW